MNGYQYRPYPRMLYRGDETTIVQDAVAEAVKLRDGWVKLPGAVGAPEPAQAVEDASGWPIPVLVEDASELTSERASEPAPEPAVEKRGPVRPRKAR